MLLKAFQTPPGLKTTLSNVEIAAQSIRDLALTEKRAAFRQNRALVMEWRQKFSTLNPSALPVHIMRRRHATNPCHAVLASADF